jgi:signal transduction histidine kinase
VNARSQLVTTSARAPDITVIAGLSALAAEVQKQRTAAAIMQTAGEGIVALGMRLCVFEIVGSDLVLRHLATTPTRHRAIERRIGRPLVGLSAPVADLEHVRDVVMQRRIVHRDDLELFHSLVRTATGFDPATLDVSPETRGINNGVLAPIIVRGEPWGLLGLASRMLTREDAHAVALFATQVGSALEVVATIAALEHSNRELARTQRDLVERERLAALGKLAAVVAHEVRNPLCVLFSAIGGLREYLAGGAPLARRADAEVFASIAAEEAARLNRIVSDLLDFARPHTPQLRIGPLLPVLEGVAAATPDQRIRLDVADELPPVEIDELFMRQAVLNLVLNGLQAIGKDGTITLRARSEERSAVCIDVIDDGPGIPDDVRESIFKPFFTTKATGTGLGLAVVKQIIDAHGGDVAVVSSPRGTTFTVRLRAATAA